MIDGDVREAAVDILSHKILIQNLFRWNIFHFCLDDRIFIQKRIRSIVVECKEDVRIVSLYSSVHVGFDKHVLEVDNSRVIGCFFYLDSCFELSIEVLREDFPHLVILDVIASRRICSQTEEGSEVEMCLFNIRKFDFIGV